MRAPLRLRFPGPMFPIALLAFAAGCSNDDVGGVSPSPSATPTAGGPTIPADEKPTGGKTVELALTAADAAEFTQLKADTEAALSMSRSDFDAKYAVSHVSSLSYDPTTATNFDLVQASALALNDGELDAFRRNGFVISKRQGFPTYSYGYANIYSQDLPLYVSADSIADALHQSYDDILKAVEVSALIPELRAMLDESRTALSGSAALFSDAHRDADFFFAVALSLLEGQAVPPVSGADPSLIATFLSKAEAAEGIEDIDIFGVSRTIDFSQFKPRGHYTDSPELERYFRAMMWLGRIDFRLIETQPDHSQVFYRRQLETVLELWGALSGPSARWERIDATVRAFVGESDYMTLPDVPALLADLGISTAAELANIPDQQIAQTIIDSGYGSQRISSHIMINGTGEGTMPLNRSFAVFGQRYVVDSHVFSNLVYDRVGGGAIKRMMPNPLDVGFAALQNNDAAGLLAPELDTYPYQGDLAAMRVLVDAHGDDFWSANLYNQWLASLRALSPGVETADPASVGLPAVTGTEAWGRRVLNTQLASWAQLRHDTILYAKQSYTSGISCEFPDAYVDPYPAFYDRIADLATSGRSLSEHLATISADLGVRITAYFDELHRVATLLGDMARAERAGTPFTDEQMAFINEAVISEGGVCGLPPTYSGWYPRLVFDQSDEIEPTIADVHTQPTDEAGNVVGNVLHVGTGGPRLMVVAADTCSGPKAYVGLAATYYEKITQNFERLTDEEWAPLVFDEPDVPWVAPIVAP